MFEFGIYAIVLLLCALSFVILPLLLKKDVTRLNDDETNIELTKNKIRELKADLVDGNLSEADFNAAKRELEVGLYHDLNVGNPVYSQRGTGSWLAWPLLFLLPIVALLLYANLGDFRAFEVSEAPKANSAQAGHSSKDNINQMIAKLTQRLQQNPEDLEGWLMLGRSFKATQRFKDAVSVLRKASELQANNPEIMLDLADAIAMSNEGSLQGEPTVLIESALKIEPDNRMGLWLSGLAKADTNDYDGAIRVWKKLQTQFQPGQEDYSEIQNLIDTAVARKSGKSDPVAKAEPKTTAKDSDEIMVKVDIDAAIKSKLEPSDTVFVYVKALEGPKMPLAVAKHQVKDLPLQIKFDDSMAMMPNLKLSLFDKVIVTARVSKQGNAIPQPGEPIGSAELVKPKSKSVAVKINSFN